MSDQYISDAALAVLRAIECDSDPYRARITSGQLDRPLYDEVNEVLVRLGGKWKGGRTAAHIFPYYDPHPLLSGVVATGLMPPKNPTAFFPTPPGLIEQVCQSSLFAEIREGDRILEPSAGVGALAQGIRQRLAHLEVQIDCCEILPINQQVLRDKGFSLVHDDFLTYTPQQRYRAIIMNPPFTIETDRLCYITHIYHAWKLLEEDGFIISFAPSGYTFRSDRKSYDFLTFVLTYGGFEELPAKSFHQSGTDSKITLLSLTKQDQSWRYHPYNGYPSRYCYDLILHADNGDDEFSHEQRRINEQLTRQELCADPNLPGWAETREAIRKYYQLVIASVRKKGHKHLDIRLQDWSYLERRFMTQWNETWAAGEHQKEESKEAVYVAPSDTSEGADEEGAPQDTLVAPIPAPLASADAPLLPSGEENEAPLLVCLPAGTPIYSPLPGDPTSTYEQICESYDLLGKASSLSRESYPALPWILETLVGTTWRHIQRGDIQIIHHLDVNHFGRPILCAASTENTSTPAALPIGFWSGGRYVIEHWVRVDHLRKEVQLHWYAVALAWLRGQIALCEQKIAEYQLDRVNRELHLHMQKAYQFQLQVAEGHMRDFAARHHLAIPLDVLNSGLQGSERDPAQMALL